MWFRKNSASEISRQMSEVYPRLWRYCFTLTRTHDLADDLAQNSCSRALEKSHLFRPGTHFDRWIFRIAHRIWLNDLRNSKVRQGSGVIPIEEAQLTDTNLDPESNILGGEVLSAVMQLPDEQRLTVFLAYVEGYTYKECAEMLDIPIGTVMSRLASARGKLAAKFQVEESGK